MLLALPGAMLNAQNHFEVKSLDKSDVLMHYTSVDESGNPIELLAALKVSVNQKECDARGVPLYIKSTEKKEYNRPKLYCAEDVWRWDSGLFCKGKMSGYICIF